MRKTPRMELRVVGAGLGRTGTLSLKTALERLLGGRCYHMIEIFGHPEHAPVWQAAAEGVAVDWDRVLAEYDMTIDWPTSAFWRELTAANPEAIILLSTRNKRADVVEERERDDLRGYGQPRSGARPGLARCGMPSRPGRWNPASTTTRRWQWPATTRATRRCAEADPSRLVEWQPGDGWEPLSAVLKRRGARRTVPAPQRQRGMGGAPSGSRHLGLDRPADVTVRERGRMLGSSTGQRQVGYATG